MQAQIGEQAERLVYLYALLLRASLYENLDRGWPYSIELRDGTRVSLRNDEFVGLMTLDLANRLEQTHGPLGHADRTTYGKAIPVLPAAAIEALRPELQRPERLGIARSAAKNVPGARRLKRALLG